MRRDDNFYVSIYEEWKKSGEVRYKWAEKKGKVSTIMSWIKRGEAIKEKKIRDKIEKINLNEKDLFLEIEEEDKNEIIKIMLYCGYELMFTEKRENIRELYFKKKKEIKKETLQDIPISLLNLKVIQKIEVN